MKNFRRPSSQRGSLLIVAMLLCAIIGIAIASYLQLGTRTMQISNRGLYVGAAMNLAENGLEMAVYTLNTTVANPSYSWTGHGWTVSGSDAKQKWTGYTFDQGVTGQTQAYVYNYNGSAAPKAIAHSTVTLPSGATLEKWVEVQLRKTSKFSNGLVAKQTITFAGNNATVDSWNSMYDDSGNLRGSPAAYSSTVRHDKGSVGSISVGVNSVLVKNADIWGYASTGGALPVVGSQGRVGPFGTALGTMDMTHVSTDFTAPIDPVTAPTKYTVTTTSGGTTTTTTYDVSWHPYGGAITNDESLPRASDPISNDGKYYISADSVNFNNKTLTISNKVVLLLTNTMTGIDIGGGSGQLTINSGASLEVYTAGSVSIAGNGILNGGNTATTANQPVNCQIYGTKTSLSQDISIAGNGVLSAVVYAPNGSIKINGNGDVMGSMVGNDITVVGEASFHYDESLANFGGNNPYRVSKWKELTTDTERSVYASLFAGW